MKYDRIEDVPPKYRVIIDRDYTILNHVLDNLAYAGTGFGISAAVAKLFWRHTKRFSMFYKELDYYAQIELCPEGFNPPKPLEFVADNRELIKKVIQRFIIKAAS